MWNAGKYCRDGETAISSGWTFGGDADTASTAASSTAARPMAAAQAHRTMRRWTSSTPWWEASPTLPVRRHLKDEEMWHSHGSRSSCSDSNVVRQRWPSKRGDPTKVPGKRGLRPGRLVSISEFQRNRVAGAEQTARRSRAAQVKLSKDRGTRGGTGGKVLDGGGLRTVRGSREGGMG